VFKSVSSSAALTDSFYSSGMCFGRLASILLSTAVLPSTLLAVCMLACLLATLLLIFLAPIFHISLYTGVAIMGFFISWQFGTGFSWTSRHINITGRLSSIFFLGKQWWSAFSHRSLSIRTWCWQSLLSSSGWLALHAQPYECDLCSGCHGSGAGGHSGGNVGGGKGGAKDMFYRHYVKLYYLY
jgi:hypothetical protein